MSKESKFREELDMQYGLWEKISAKKGASQDTERAADKILSEILPTHNPHINSFFNNYVHLLSLLSASSINFSGIEKIVADSEKNPVAVYVYTPRHTSQFDLVLGKEAVMKVNNAITEAGIERKTRETIIPIFHNIFDVPVLGGILRRAHLIPNQRTTMDRFYRNLWGAYFINAVREHDMLTFLEGTRTRTGQLLDFQKEFIVYLMVAKIANETDIRLVPTGLGYLAPEGPRLFDSNGAHTSKKYYKQELKHTIDLFTIGGIYHKFGEIQVNFGEPFSLSAYFEPVDKQEVLEEFVQRTRGETSWGYLMKRAKDLAPEIRKKVISVTPTVPAQVLCRALTDSTYLSDLPSRIDSIRETIEINGGYTFSLPNRANETIELGREAIQRQYGIDIMRDNSSKANTLLNYLGVTIEHFF